MARLVRDGGRGRGVAAVEEMAPPLPLPPPPRLASAALSSSSPASIRALLARTGGGADCQQSPRSLLSRILLRGGGDHHGGNGGGSFGCRVRLPRRYGSSSSSVGDSIREERKDDGAASEQSADDVGSARVKVVERSPELPVDTPRSSLGKKKPEEEVMSMSLRLGASLVLLLSKSAVELNKMVELRAQMEALVSEIRHETIGKEKHGGSAPAASSSSSQESTVIKDPIARAEDALSGNCSGARTADRRQLSAAVVAMDHNKMEAELQLELSRMQAQHRAMHAPIRGLELPPLQVKTARSAHVSVDTTSRSCVVDHATQVNADEEDGEDEEDQREEDYDEEEEGDDDDDGGEVVDRDRSPPHGGVSARALERRLHELLQRRQQDRIVELEAALDGAQRRLQEREREVVWWRDAAKLVSHRRDESRRLRCTAPEPVR
ncbi:uncharacterized protein LOC123408274 [Hordeum vulgare subsp. vulgare]|uniref:Uncharacterized protein n=1 Tax=Hordeum vulgare subsp. vulgare TaxID=112509 RepID=A0A8I7BDJ0_HORVV|nr:uncharacterized protein LOC123408274 [Hordeum vulgare subsp. vulgare]